MLRPTRGYPTLSEPKCARRAPANVYRFRGDDDALVLAAEDKAAAAACERLGLQTHLNTTFEQVKYIKKSELYRHRVFR